MREIQIKEWPEEKSEPVDLIVFSCDKDGAFSNNFTVKLRKLASIQLISEVKSGGKPNFDLMMKLLKGCLSDDVEKKILYETNRVFMKQMLDYCMQKTKHVIIINGSNNQAYDTDLKNREDPNSNYQSLKGTASENSVRYTSSASCFSIISWIAEWFQTELDKNIICELYKYTLTDTLNHHPHGYCFDEILRYLAKPHKFPNMLSKIPRHFPSVLFESKLPLVLMHVQLLEKKNPGKNIEYWHVDDRDDIVFDLAWFFEFCPELIPLRINIKFQLYCVFYNGSIDTNSEPFDEEKVEIYVANSNDKRTEFINDAYQKVKIPPLPTIVGCGKAIPNIEELLRDTQFCSLLEKLFCRIKLTKDANDAKVIQYKETLFTFIKKSFPSKNEEEIKALEPENIEDNRSGLGYK